MMTSKEILEVVAAAEAGKKIEWRSMRHSDLKWCLCTMSPMWNFASTNYRVAPNQKKKVKLYQWLCMELGPGHYYLSDPMESSIISKYARRLDETMIEVEVEE